MADEASEHPLLLGRARLDAPRGMPVPGGRTVLFSTASPAKDTDNEDAALVVHTGDGRVVLAVADGVGGQAAGARASTHVLGTLAEAVAKAGPEQGLRSTVLDAIERASADVTSWGLGAGTTLALVTIEGGRLRPFHVGDAQVLLTGQRSRLRLQTVAHSPVGYAVEAGVLEEEEAIHHEDRHLVSNVVGATDMRIEIGAQLALHARDTLVLASDGLFDNLAVPEVVERIRVGPLERAGARLAADALERMRSPVPGRPSKPDDITFVLYRPRGAARAGGRPS